jgi:phage recombination protein Bet
MSTELATPSQPPRASLLVAMAAKYGMEPETFKQVIKATVMPAGATNEQMAAFLLVAHEYDLNPITKEIYAFPAKGGGVTPVVGVDGWINLAQRRPEFDGMEHRWENDEQGHPIACTCLIYRKDRGRPVVVTEFADECRRQTDPWHSHPRRMLRHKATIQAIRYAFGFSGIKDEDDAEVIYGGSAEIVQPATPVADLNARLAAEAKLADRASEWPQTDPQTGQPVDARGCPWIEGAHSAGRICDSTGIWKRKRGADPALIERLEREAMTPAVEGVAEDPTAPKDPESAGPHSEAL